ncbi:hypothetical protein U5903_04315 [Cereibacter johrii]|uniref:hypothetical protein n=1 Tax=Cereibacter johrii TaxID=445629 RepID=UPI002B25D642|nr:hypothetical protein [Cereibacter johrii]MEA5159993.1 hypothetical protein [Cereibacter johrii]
MTSSRPAVLLKSDIIPADTLASLDRGDLTISQLISAIGLPRTAKNRVYRILAMHIRAGLAPASLLRFQSIRDFYERNPAVVTPDLETAPATVSATAAQVDSLRRKLADMTARAREAEEALEAERGLSEVLHGIVATPAAPPSWLVDWIPHTGRDVSVPVLMLADWHLGEVVNPATAGGYAYNVTIAEDRIRRTVERTIHLARRHLAGLSYPGIVAALVGDLVSGGIHAELAESDELSLIKSVLKARDLAIGCIDALKSEFGNVYVPCATGNHGRFMDRKPRAKGYAERNADFLIYQLLSDHYRDDDRVVIDAPESGETLFRIFGRTFLLTHGDKLGAKGGDGLIGAIGPIMRGVLKTSKSLDSLGTRIDHLLCGHWHQSLYLPTATVTGALKGPDEYSLGLLRAPAEDPSQTLLFIHPEHGLTFRQPIFLRDEWCPDRSREAADKRWLTVFGDAA